MIYRDASSSFGYSIDNLESSARTLRRTLLANTVPHAKEPLSRSLPPTLLVSEVFVVVVRPYVG